MSIETIMLKQIAIRRKVNNENQPPRNESLLLVRTVMPDGATVGILTPICPTLTRLWNVATCCGEDVKIEQPLPSVRRSSQHLLTLMSGIEVSSHKTLHLFSLISSMASSIVSTSMQMSTGPRISV